jgi:hypothetical protein
MDRHNSTGNALVIAGSAFALGVVAGLLLKDNARQLVDRARSGLWHREYQRTVTYDENLPESLARREPAPETGEPRFGGTGALGVHPSAVPQRP